MPVVVVFDALAHAWNVLSVFACMLLSALFGGCESFEFLALRGNKVLLRPVHRESAVSEDDLMESYEWIASCPGKGLREAWIKHLGGSLGVPDASIEIIVQVMAKMHTASLVLDDIEDDSVKRRGIPAAHIQFGIPLSVNSACWALFQALDRLKELKLPAEKQLAVQDLMRAELLGAHHGQGLDIYWRTHGVCPTKEEYLKMVSQKTTTLFRLGYLLLVAASPNAPSSGLPSKSDLQAIETFGKYFQIRDDYANLASAQYSAKKGFCEDFEEGKFSYPIVHCLSNAKAYPRQANELFLWLRRRPKSRFSKQKMLQLLRDTKAMAATKQELEATLRLLKKQLAKSRLQKSFLPIMSALSGSKKTK